uniref:Uncharacterized protein n=1 Tax=Protohalopteris sp. TaxID=2843287 RepID=A0A8F0F7C2_9PHAE|nr:hypothetical protein [Protohalopteris sp.]
MNRNRNQNNRNKNNKQVPKLTLWQLIWRSVVRSFRYIKNNPWRSLAVFMVIAYLVIQFHYCEGDWLLYANRNIRMARFTIKAYYWLLTLRFTVQWFPNINPYIHPLYGLIWATDLFLRQFENFLPDILGLDMSSMCAFACLEWMMQTLDAMYVIMNVPADFIA